MTALLFAVTLPMRYHFVVAAPGLIIGIILALFGWGMTRVVSRGKVYALLWIPLILACAYRCFRSVFELGKLIQWAGNNYGPGGGPFMDLIAWAMWGVCSLPPAAVLLALLLNRPGDEQERRDADDVA